MLATYNISIEDCDAENGEYLGVFEIANTANPAIMIKGIALSDVKQMIFKDDLLYRIASPVLIPSKIFRRDPETGEEYYVNVSAEVVEKMFMKFQKDRSGKDIFNIEHDETKRVPSYILETWLVENPKLDKSLSTYGIECPAKTWFAVQQFTDKIAYQKCVDEGQIGFSIHGESALKFSKQVINKPNNMSKKRMYVAQFTEASMADSGDIIVSTEDLKEGATVQVLDSELKPIENFTGELTIEDEAVVITDNVVTSMGVAEEVELKEGDAPKEVELAKEPIEMAVEPAVEPVELEVDATVETYTNAEIDVKLEEIYAMIAELKVAQKPVELAEEVEEKPKTKMEIKMSRVDNLNKFHKSNK